MDGNALRAPRRDGGMLKQSAASNLQTNHHQRKGGTKKHISHLKLVEVTSRASRAAPGEEEVAKRRRAVLQPACDRPRLTGRAPEDTDDDTRTDVGLPSVNGGTCREVTLLAVEGNIQGEHNEVEKGIVVLVLDLALDVAFPPKATVEVEDHDVAKMNASHANLRGRTQTNGAWPRSGWVVEGLQFTSG